MILFDRERKLEIFPDHEIYPNYIDYLDKHRYLVPSMTNSLKSRSNLKRTSLCNHKMSHILLIRSENLVNIATDKVNRLLLAQPSATILISRSGCKSKIAKLPVLVQSYTHRHVSIKQRINDGAIRERGARQDTA